MLLNFIYFRRWNYWMLIFLVCVLCCDIFLNFVVEWVCISINKEWSDEFWVWMFVFILFFFCYWFLLFWVNLNFVVGFGRLWCVRVVFFGVGGVDGDIFRLVLIFWVKIVVGWVWILGGWFGGLRNLDLDFWVLILLLVIEFLRFLFFVCWFLRRFEVLFCVFVLLFVLVVDYCMYWLLMFFFCGRNWWWCCISRFVVYVGVFELFFLFLICWFVFLIGWILFLEVRLYDM